jgi:CRISPR-associated exonuclease Cas4
MADQNNENITIGRALASLNDDFQNNHFLSNMNFDRLEKRKNGWLAIEHKKSLKNKIGAISQLQFYIYLINISKINMKIIKAIIQTKSTKVIVDISDKIMLEVENNFLEIEKLIKLNKPPLFKEIKFCKKCAYNDYCFS